MKHSWTKNIKDEKLKEEFRNKVKGSKAVLDRQAEILQEWLDVEFNASIGAEDFDSPNWALLQAYRKAKMRAYKEVLSLIKDVDK